MYADQEATVRTGCGATDWFKIGKGVCQVYILNHHFIADHISWVKNRELLIKLLIFKGTAYIKACNYEDSHITTAMQYRGNILNLEKDNQ